MLKNISTWLIKIARWPFVLTGFLFQPDQRINSFIEIKLGQLWERGYRGIILDLDNTILPRKEKLLNSDFVKWLEGAQKMGFQLAIVSNNFKKKRLINVFAQTRLVVVNPAFKPLPFGFQIALRKIKIPARRIIVIGDQLTTDILGGRILGSYTILTEPLYLETNPFRKFVQDFDGIFRELFLKK